MDEYTRDPCPWRIVDDCGGAFTMGLVGGSLLHTYKGYKMATKGKVFSSIAHQIRTKAPNTAGGFGVWGFTFSLIDCTLVGIRKKEDPFNSIASGALTGAVIASRNGIAAMTFSAAIGGVLLAMIEGISVAMNYGMASQFDPENRMVMEEPPPTAPVTSPNPSAEEQDNSKRLPFSLPSLIG